MFFSYVTERCGMFALDALVDGVSFFFFFFFGFFPQKASLIRVVDKVAEDEVREKLGVLDVNSTDCKMKENTSWERVGCLGLFPLIASWLKEAEPTLVRCDGILQCCSLIRGYYDD